MKFSFVAAKQVAYSVVAMCRLLGVSTSGYYAWKKRPPSKRVGDDARLAVDIVAAHERSRGIYGSRRVHRELRSRGVRVAEKRVARLMRDNGLRGRQKRRWCHTTDSRHAQPIAPNVLERNFDALAPNRAWVGDVTYIPTARCAVVGRGPSSWRTPTAAARMRARTTAPRSPHAASWRA